MRKKLTALRRKSGLSQEELAQKMDVSRQAVSKWESGQTMPDVAKLVALSKLMDVSLDYLLRDEEEVPEQTDETQNSVPVTPDVMDIPATNTKAERWSVSGRSCISNSDRMDLHWQKGSSPSGIRPSAASR